MVRPSAAVMLCTQTTVTVIAIKAAVDDTPAQKRPYQTMFHVWVTYDRERLALVSMCNRLHPLARDLEEKFSHGRCACYSRPWLRRPRGSTRSKPFTMLVIHGVPG